MENDANMPIYFKTLNSDVLFYLFSYESVTVGEDRRFREFKNRCTDFKIEGKKGKEHKSHLGEFHSSYSSLDSARAIA